jgi:alanine dehydrogenase
MIAGVPREIKDNDYRVAATSAGVRELEAAGHQVLVEAGAGWGSSMPDEAYV